MIKDLILSFFDITKNIIFAKKAKILFYYPQHFNRSAMGTNPFFDSMLIACKKNGISYKLIEEPDYGTNKPRNKKAIKGDVLFWMIIAIRKIVRNIFRFSDEYRNEVHVAHIVNILTLGKLQYNKFITISGSMYHLLPHLKKGSDVYDMQHGILFKGHHVFFDQSNNRKLFPQFYPQCLHWLFWGEGYKECFVRGEEEHLEGKCHVVGYPVYEVSGGFKEFQEVSEDNKVILVSLQFTADWKMEKLEQIKLMIISMLEELKETGVKVLLKHHPRYNNMIDICDILEKFDYVEETKETLQQLRSKTLLQVTFSSTTTFEYAEEGIPSFFLGNNNYPQDENLFYEEYRYPLYAGMNIIDVVARLQNPKNYNIDSRIVKNWYNKFYTPFDEEAFLKLIQ